MIRLGIIGVAGRKPTDEQTLSTEHLEWMASNVLCYIEHVLETTPDNVILVSGGSAWSDHVAVQLYLLGEFGGFELYLPTSFDLLTKKFVNNREGYTLNLLHEKCFNKTKIDVFDELFRVINDPNIKVVVKDGFFARNTLIAKNSDHLIAFTFDLDAPTRGGTFDTWKKTKHNNKLHLSLQQA